MLFRLYLKHPEGEAQSGFFMLQVMSKYTILEIGSKNNKYRNYLSVEKHKKREMFNVNKIVLIEPKTKKGHVYSTVQMPRLGLPLLGTQLKEAGYDVRIYVAQSNALPWTKILEADLVGISTTSSTSREAYRIAGYLRSQNIPVVIGGIHATFMPEEALQYADYVVRGEADHTFLELIRSLEEGASPENIPGISYWSNGKKLHNPSQEG